jgi:hypothetical protein
VRGRERRPGEFRATPVWIGSPTDTPENATYVPPLSDEMHEALRDWELFANEEPPDANAGEVRAAALPVRDHPTRSWTGTDGWADS